LPSRSELRRKARRRALITVGILLAVGGTFPLWSAPLGRVVGRQIVEWNRHFLVEHTYVVGNHRLASDDLVKLAAVKEGTSLFSVPVATVKDRIEKNPWVRYAFVRRRLPNAVEIRIVEREPAAALRGESMFVITTDSVALNPLSQNWVWDLPLLTPPHSVRLRAGTAVRDTAALALLRESLKLRDTSPTAWRNLSELYYRDGQIFASMSQPPVALELGAGVSDLAWAIAVSFMTTQPPNGWSQCQKIDLRIPGKIIVTQNTSIAEGQVSG
jgi:cell division septal protein FtsQ